MKIENFSLRNIAGEYVVVPIGKNSINFKAMMSLNETAAFLWKKLETEISKEELVDNLVEEYDVSKEKAEKDVDNFISMLKEHKIIEE